MPGGRVVKTADFTSGPAAAALCLKPVNEGSSVGVAIVTAGGQLRQPDQPRRRPAVAGFRRTAGRAVHSWPELTTAVLGDKALMVTELKPKSGFMILPPSIPTA
jgi:D-alanine-D-alanine ligase